MPFIAHPQIRNRGTIGGSLAHADPAAELPAVAVALQARFRLQRAGGDRWVEASSFFAGLFATALEPDEILTEVRIPPLPPRTGWAFLEVSRRLGDYAQVGIAALVTLDEAGRCANARLVYLSVGGAPVDAREAAAPAGGRRNHPGGHPGGGGQGLAGGNLSGGGRPRHRRLQAPPGPRAHRPGLAQGRGKGFEMSDLYKISTTVNGRAYDREVEPRTLLSDFLRHDLGLTGTHVGCEHGVCGACTVLFDGEPARSCIMLAVQADGHAVTTVESLAPGPDRLHPLQQAFWECHGLQCGFCTPGFLMTLVPFLEENPDPSEDEIRHAISGNLCRCTGYQHIVDAVKLAAQRRNEQA